MSKLLRFAFIVSIVLTIGTAAQAGYLDEAGAAAPVSHISSSVRLAKLTPAEKANAQLSLEPLGPTDLAADLQAANVVELWNSGRFTEAVAALENLEASGARYADVISWKVPVPSRPGKWYQDEQIGSPRTGAIETALDYDSETDNLFIAVRWGDTWTMNFSSDDCHTWVETFSFGESDPMDMSVSGDYAWVGYSSGGEARMRRFNVATGAADNGYGFHTVATISPNTVTEVAVIGNAPETNNRIYLAYIVDETNSIGYWWDDLGGTSFSNISPSMTDVAEGLDITFNIFTQIGGDRFWLSYLGTDNTIHVYRSAGSSTWTIEANWTFTGLQRYTGISAYADNVYAVFSNDSGAGGYGIGYVATDDAGGSWVYDDAYYPPSGQPDAMGPDISVRSGTGRAVVFTTDETTSDIAWSAARTGWATGAWNSPLGFSNYDASWGTRTEIEWLGANCVMAYGMVYIADGAIPYFDVITGNCFFEDGFESGNFSGWDSVNP